MIVSFLISSDAERDYCLNISGTIEEYQSGYGLVSICCVAIGTFIMILYSQRKIRQLERIPNSEWRLRR